jgi:hypothetical protein
MRAPRASPGGRLDAQNGTLIPGRVLSVDETAEGTVRGVEIQDEHGECIRIQFGAAPVPEALDGIAPGELPT